jgi:hypothetical protein
MYWRIKISRVAFIFVQNKDIYMHLWVFSLIKDGEEKQNFNDTLLL